MKRVTKNNILKMIQMKKDYEKTGNKDLLKEINFFIEQGINRDQKYFSKLRSYDLTREQLAYCI